MCSIRQVKVGYICLPLSSLPTGLNVGIVVLFCGWLEGGHWCLMNGIKTAIVG